MEGTILTVISRKLLVPLPSSEQNIERASVIQQTVIIRHTTTVIANIR